jgi:hypothetical protein
MRRASMGIALDSRLMAPQKRLPLQVKASVAREIAGSPGEGQGHII